jgi:DNA-binding XRE family transcriptional regulator
MQDFTLPKPANNLKALRRAQRLSLWGLATRARSSATTLSAIERWGYQPGDALRQRIAAALGVAVEDVWPDTEGSGRDTASPTNTRV